MTTSTESTTARCYSCDRVIKDIQSPSVWYGSVNRFEMGFLCEDCCDHCGRVIIDTDPSEEY